MRLRGLCNTVESCSTSADGASPFSMKPVAPSATKSGPAILELFDKMTIFAPGDARYRSARMAFPEVSGSDRSRRMMFRARVVRPALRAAGLPESLRTYDIRHSHASLLIDDGANVLAVAQRMGHTDPGVTLRVYGHLFEGVQRELTDRLDRRRASTPSRTPADVRELRPRPLTGS